MLLNWFLGLLAGLNLSVCKQHYWKPYSRILMKSYKKQLVKWGSWINCFTFSWCDTFWVVEKSRSRRRSALSGCFWFDLQLLCVMPREYGYSPDDTCLTPKHIMYSFHRLPTICNPVEIWAYSLTIMELTIPLFTHDYGIAYTKLHWYLLV